jgi:hypothetical protein
VVGAGKIGADNATLVVGAAEHDDRKCGAGGKSADSFDQIWTLGNFQVVIAEQERGEWVDAPVVERVLALEVREGRLGGKEGLDVKRRFRFRNGVLEEEMIRLGIVNVNDRAIAVKELFGHGGTFYGSLS